MILLCQTISTMTNDTTWTVESGPARTTVPVASCPGMKGGVAITYIIVIGIVISIVIDRDEILISYSGLSSPMSLIFKCDRVVSSKWPGPSRSMCRGQYQSHKWPPAAITTIFKSTSKQLKGEPATIENNQKSRQKPSQANTRNHRKQGEKYEEKIH